MTNADIFWQGAEAKVTLIDFHGRKAIQKERFVKKYRLPEIDTKLVSTRIRQETRNLLKCQKNGCRVPAVYYVNTAERLIIMEYVVNESTLKNYLAHAAEEKIEMIGMEIAKAIISIHKSNIIHGDLTSSNMLVTMENEKLSIAVIDFGLSYVSSIAEDRAVDLYVFERSLTACYSKRSQDPQNIMNIILKEYKSVIDDVQSKKKSSVIQRYDEVKLRGRKRLMIG